MSVAGFFIRRVRSIIASLLTLAGLIYFISAVQAPRTVTTSGRTLNPFIIPYTLKKPTDRESLYGADDGSWHAAPLVSKDGSPAQTNLLAYASGNSIFERLYLHRGTLYVVTEQRETIPDIKFITSSGGLLQELPTPTAADFSVITVDEARDLFTASPVVLPGTTSLITENAQFAAHYYHFGAEIMLSLWRTYMYLDPLVPVTGKTRLAAPSRLMYSHVNSTQWRDRAHVVPWLVRAMFGSIEMSFAEDWLEMASMDYTFVFDRVVIFDRWAAENGPNSGRVRKCTAEAFSLGHVENFWEPIRRTVLGFAGRAKNIHLTRESDLPLITYVSRQKTGRRLTDESHDQLVDALAEAQGSLGFELKIAVMEDISKAEQVKLSSQTTILIGVHGNGLSNMLWMERSPRSTVMEIHLPGAFIVDYEVTARFLGHQYRCFWNDTYFIENQHPQTLPGMHGSSIIVHAPTVIAAIAEILSQQ